MTIISRPCRGEADYQKERELLFEGFKLDQRLHNWGLDRWDVFRYAGRMERASGRSTFLSTSMTPNVLNCPSRGFTNLGHSGYTRRCLLEHSFP